MPLPAQMSNFQRTRKSSTPKNILSPSHASFLRDVIQIKDTQPTYWNTTHSAPHWRYSNLRQLGNRVKGPLQSFPQSISSPSKYNRGIRMKIKILIMLEKKEILSSRMYDTIFRDEYIKLHHHQALILPCETEIQCIEPVWRGKYLIMQYSNTSTKSIYNNDTQRYHAPLDSLPSSSTLLSCQPGPDSFLLCPFLCFIARWCIRIPKPSKTPRRARLCAKPPGFWGFGGFWDHGVL